MEESFHLQNDMDAEEAGHAGGWNLEAPVVDWDSLEDHSRRDTPVIHLGNPGALEGRLDHKGRKRHNRF